MRDPDIRVLQKTCFKCSRLLDADKFYRHEGMADGLMGKCIECTKRGVQANYRLRREQYRQYERERQRTLKRRAAKTEYQRRARLRTPEKSRARKALQRAVRTGKVARPAQCPRCGGDDRIEAHHTDYSKPLDVQWLCFACHRRDHGQEL